MDNMVVGISAVQVLQRPTFVPHADAEMSHEPRKKIVHDLSDDQKELRSIRIRLGMTKQVFAKALEIKQCTLDSYEYGKTKGVPADTMKSAHALDSQKSDLISSSRQQFESKPMSTILGDWAEKLNIPIDNATALGRLLNTTPTTIRRWRENKVRPDISKLAKLAARVSQGPDGALKIAAIYAIKKIRSDSAESKGSVFIPENALHAALQRLRDIPGPSDALSCLITDFDAAINVCKRIPGDPSFIQMSALTLNGFVRRFLGELAFDEIDEEPSSD